MNVSKKVLNHLSFRSDISTYFYTKGVVKYISDEYNDGGFGRCFDGMISTGKRSGDFNFTIKNAPEYTRDFLGKKVICQGYFKNDENDIIFIVSGMEEK